MNKLVKYLHNSIGIGTLLDLLHEFTTSKILRGDIMTSNLLKLKHL